jgi:hypothetical protein
LLPLLLLIVLPLLQVCNQHGSQAQWSNHGILKACLEGSPLDKLAAVATVQVRGTVLWLHVNMFAVRGSCFAASVVVLCVGAR